MTDTPAPGQERLGEIIEASVPAFVAQCHRLGEPPALGSLVKTSDHDTDIYAVVYNSATGSIDPGRRFAALGQDEASEEDIHRAHPELQQLLRTDFQALVIGHSQAGKVYHRLPPRPARIHAFVHPASEGELRAFTKSLRFLHTMVNSETPTRDDTLSSFLRAASRTHAEPEEFLVEAGKALASLLSRDIQRLDTLLHQLRP